MQRSDANLLEQSSTEIERQSLFERLGTGSREASHEHKNDKITRLGGFLRCPSVRKELGKIGFPAIDVSRTSSIQMLGQPEL